LGRRATALRRARAPAVRPISASSAAACTAVPRTSAPVFGTEPRERGDGGAPAGWAGWRNRLGAGRVAGVGLAAGLVAVVLAFGAADLVFARGAAAVDLVFGVVAAGAAASASIGRAARLSLRRCGRRCGSAERTSEEEEFWSVIARFQRC